MLRATATAEQYVQVSDGSATAGIGVAHGHWPSRNTSPSHANRFSAGSRPPLQDGSGAMDLPSWRPDDSPSQGRVEPCAEIHSSSSQTSSKSGVQGHKCRCQAIAG